jgi:LacI family transcriptional regulator
MKRAGFAELAAAAGVSLATVDRALNGRQQVRRETVEHIAAVARRIGHPAAVRFGGGAAAARPHVRFGVALHKQGQDFYRAFAEALHSAVAQEASAQGRLVLEFSTSQAPSEMARLMRSMAGRCDVLAATAVDHSDVTAAVADLRAGGMAVYALLSDFAPALRSGYLGLDNRKVGRVAGWMMARAVTAPGKLAVFVGGQRWTGHQQRDRGFRDYLRETAPELEVLDTQINLETRALTYEAVLALLRAHPTLRGIYVAGGGMEGAIAALRAARAKGLGDGQVQLIVSALTPESRRGLAEGLVTLAIDTPLPDLCRAMFATMAGAALGTPQAGPADLYLPPVLTLPEML